tara:strand:+ start:179 stop:385 length:207 start_codon:yes stop_codon:yes gene_type:complete
MVKIEPKKYKGNKAEYIIVPKNAVELIRAKKIAIIIKIIIMKRIVNGVKIIDFQYLKENCQALYIENK